MGKEEIDFLEKEIANCEEERLKAIKTAESAINARDFYSRRKEFLIKIKDLIT